MNPLLAASLTRALARARARVAPGEAGRRATVALRKVLVGADITRPTAQRPAAVVSRQATACLLPPRPKAICITRRRAHPRNTRDLGAPPFATPSTADVPAHHADCHVGRAWLQHRRRLCPAAGQPASARRQLARRRKRGHAYSKTALDLPNSQGPPQSVLCWRPARRRRGGFCRRRGGSADASIHDGMI